MGKNENPEPGGSRQNHSDLPSSNRGPYQGAYLFRRGLERHDTLTVVVSIGCCLLMLLTALPPVRGSSSGNPPVPTGVPNPNPNLDYIYNVSAALFPTPSYVSNTSSSNPVSLVQIIALPSTVLPYGMINVSTLRTGSSAIWFESGGYVSLLALAHERSGCQGVSVCTGIPVAWNLPIKIASVTSPFVSDGLISAGNTLVVAASTSISTDLYGSSTAGESWSSLGSTISGVTQSLAANSTDVSLVTRLGSTWTETVMNLTGKVLSSTTLEPSGSGSTGILAASASFVQSGNASVLAVAFTTMGSDEVQLETSSNPPAGFSSASVVGTFQAALPSSPLSSIGETPLYPRENSGSQVCLTSVEDELFLA